MMTQALIVDFGGVLTYPQSAASTTGMAALASLPVEDFVERYWRYRAAYDRGLSGASYWSRVLDGVQGLPAGMACFVDDRIENVAAAEGLGCRPFHFRDDDAPLALARVFGLDR
jgi:hypothetical protein